MLESDGAALIFRMAASVGTPEVFHTAELHLEDHLVHPGAVDRGEIQKRLIRGVMRKEAAARPFWEVDLDQVLLYMILDKMLEFS